jgi:hypothetical protein
MNDKKINQKENAIPRKDRAFISQRIFTSRE